MLVGPRVISLSLPCGGRHGTRKRVLVLLAVIVLLSGFITPVVAARDVKVALTELRPTLFTDDHGKPTGFFVDLINDVAAQEGWNVIWVPGTLSESWDRLARGEIDLLPGVADTPERENLYDFSHESAFSVWSQVYARHDSGINTILDLDGKRIAVVRGTVNENAVRDYAKKFGINATFLEKDTPPEIFAATASGEADALVVFNTAAQEDAKTYHLSATPVMFNPIQFGFAVQKGKNQDLLAATDQYIQKGKNNPSSTYSRAMQKWFAVSGATAEIIPQYVWGGLAGIAALAGLFVVMSVVLRREVRKKTAELSRQNENLQAEVASRTRAEAELTKKNQELNEAYGRLTSTEEKLRQNYQELNAAYEQLTSTEEELRQNYHELRRSEQALMQARKRLSLLNTLTFEDIRNAVFSLDGYIELAKQASPGEKAESYLGKGGEILHAVRFAMQSAKKYQELGIHPPRWQDVNITLINAISHLDFSHIHRTSELDGLQIYADPLLEDVFFVLMQNILTHGEGATEVRIRYRKGTGSLTITIEDNGPGIPDTDKEKIFGWDYRTTKGGGGLFLAREILSITGIAIRETGVQGSGARFEIIVPEGAYRFPE